MLNYGFLAIPEVLIGITGVLGLTIGSFLNVVVFRLPKMLEKQWLADCKAFLAQHEESKTSDEVCSQTKGFSQTNSDRPSDENTEAFNLMVPRSHCPICHHKIRAWENIPVISYLLLRGRCSQCATPISKRYPLTELFTGIISAYLAYHFGLSWQLLASLLLFWSLITLTLIDWDTQLLPDQITLPLLWLGLAMNTQQMFTDINSAVTGAILGYLSLWSVYWLFKIATGKEGMGFGDFKLLAALGAWLGWQSLPSIILLSSIVGIIIGGGSLLLQGKDRSQPIPFGPYLAIAGAISLLSGNQILLLFSF